MGETIESLLQDKNKAPFYDLLGGLADNLLTIGSYAGSFLECSACGDTFSLKGESWKCQRCGEVYELKFRPLAKREVNVSGLSKPGCKPHWYFENENWSVAEFLTQILRLQPEVFLGDWFWQLGVEVGRPAVLETVLCWPRFPFEFEGRKTIQPDVAIGFERTLC